MTDDMAPDRFGTLKFDARKHIAFPWRSWCKKDALAITNWVRKAGLLGHTPAAVIRLMSLFCDPHGVAWQFVYVGHLVSPAKGLHRYIGHSVSRGNRSSTPAWTRS